MWIRVDCQMTRRATRSFCGPWYPSCRRINLWKDWGPWISGDERAVKWPWHMRNQKSPKILLRKFQQTTRAWKIQCYQRARKSFSEALLLLLERQMPRHGDPFFAWLLAKKRRVVSDCRWKMRHYLGAFRWTRPPFTQEGVTDMLVLSVDR